MKDRISVLITFYNQEEYVDQALKSVMDQKADCGITVLVGDDGSDDSTREKVEEWIKKYPGQIKMFVVDRDREKCIPGFRASRNRLNLLKKVETEYFIFLDGDDRFDYDEKLKRQIEILDDPENQDCIACGHNTDRLYPDGERVPVSSPELKEGKLEAKEYWESLYFHTDSLLIRSSVIQKIDVSLLENNFNDNLITFSVIQYGKIYYLPYSWAVYSQTGSGIWTSDKIVINQIRNMFMIDLCDQINPSMKKETKKRLKHTWYLLYKIRKQINSEELAEYSEEARNKNMDNSYKWIHYNELSRMDKFAICTKSLMLNWKICIKEKLHCNKES